MSRDALRSRRRALPAIATSLLLAAGCGDSTGGFTRSPSERPDLDQAAVLKGGLSLPADLRFNLVSFRSGQEGASRGKAQPVGDKGAICKAEAGNAGSAWGEFQIGYCFDNHSGSRLHSAVKVRFKVATQTSKQAGADPASPSATTATGSLRFFIKDSNGTILRDEDLLRNTLEKGAGAATRQEDLTYHVTCDPGVGYYLVLVGRADVTADHAESAGMNVEVSDLSMDITWQPDRASADASTATEAVSASP